MTIVTANSPNSLVGNFLISPSGGSAKEIILTTILEIATTLITNYVKETSNAIQKKIEKQGATNSKGKARRYQYKQRGTGFQRSKVRSYGDFRWGKKRRWK